MRSQASIVLSTFALVLLACKSPPPPLPEADESSRRTLAMGEVVGFATASGGHAWLGLPFAQPPVGELRWRAPRPPQPWSETRQALAPGASCVQLANELEKTEAEPGTPIGSEDCLYANVYAPRFEPGEVPRGNARLPVMVWIHGGGNTIGSGSFYDGSQLATTHDLVVFTVNYRLGPFGWFRHAALRAGAGNAAERSGNFGTLDLIQVLRWVRMVAPAFGGDPGNVTIFGESAGGNNVMTLLLSPQAGGLFHRAILESAGTGTTEPDEGENFADDPVPGAANSSNEILLTLLQRDGTAEDRSAAKAILEAWDAGEIARYLRAQDAYEILATYVADGEQRFGMFRMPKLFRDGTVIPRQAPQERFAVGAYHRVPVILGSNRDEQKLFLSAEPEHVLRILGFYPYLRDEERYQIISDYMSRAWKANSVDELARRMRPVQGPTVFAYRFDWDEEPTRLLADLSVLMGAAHLFEVPFVFGHWDLGPRSGMLFTKGNEPGRLELSSAMMSYWAQFAYAGDPGRGRDGSLPHWKAWDSGGAETDKFIVFDTAADGGIRMSSEAVSPAALLAELASDSRLDTAHERCAIFDAMKIWWPLVTAGTDAADLGCGPGAAAGS
jgi:para-nitrobenzyl esterase